VKAEGARESLRKAPKDAPLPCPTSTLSLDRSRLDLAAAGFNRLTLLSSKHPLPYMAFKCDGRLSRPLLETPAEKSQSLRERPQPKEAHAESNPYRRAKAWKNARDKMPLTRFSDIALTR